MYHEVKVKVFPSFSFFFFSFFLLSLRLSFAKSETLDASETLHITTKDVRDQELSLENCLGLHRHWSARQCHHGVPSQSKQEGLLFYDTHEPSSESSESMNLYLLHLQMRRKHATAPTIRLI